MDADSAVILDSSGMLYGGILSFFTEKCAEDKERRRLEAKHRTGLCRKPEEGGGLEGDRRVEQIRYLLENGFKDAQKRRIVRSREQRMIHETYIRSSIAKIFQTEWEDNQERIMRKYGIEKLQQETFVVMPRRSGKTWSMAMFCAVMMVVCSDIEISIFATGQRTAGKLLKLIEKMLNSLLEFIGADNYKILQHNQEGILIIGPDGTERKCGCYPGSASVSVFPPVCYTAPEREGHGRALWNNVLIPCLVVTNHKEGDAKVNNKRLSIRQSFSRFCDGLAAVTAVAFPRKRCDSTLPAPLPFARATA